MNSERKKMLKDSIEYIRTIQKMQCMAESFDTLLREHEAMQARIDELSKDAARIDWLEKRTLINSKGTRSEGLKQDFDAKFVVMPSWYQHGKEFANLRDAIDDAKERAACNSSL